MKLGLHFNYQPCGGEFSGVAYVTVCVDEDLSVSEELGGGAERRSKHLEHGITPSEDDARYVHPDQGRQALENDRGGTAVICVTDSMYCLRT